MFRFLTKINRPQLLTQKKYQLNQLGAIQAQHPTSNGSAVTSLCAFLFPTPQENSKKIDPQRWHRRSSNILVPSRVPYWPSSNWPWPISPYRHESWPLGHWVLVGGKDGDVEGVGLIEKNGKKCITPYDQLNGWFLAILLFSTWKVAPIFGGKKPLFNKKMKKKNQISC